MKKHIYILLLSIFILSCNKISIFKYTGTYAGQSDVHSWNTVQGTSTSSNYFDTLTVSFDNDFLLINSSQKIPIDSINEGVTYTKSAGTSYCKIKFSQDSIYYSTSGGGLGGGGSSNFKGVK